MVTGNFLPRRAACVLLAALSGCGDAGIPCGVGTHEANGACVPVAQSVTCGPGSSLVGGACVADARPASQPAIAVQVSSLVLDHDDKTPLYLFHPMRITVGLKSTGLKSLVSLHFSLVPSSPSTTGATTRGCAIGGADAILTGSGDEQVFSYEFLVPKHCPMGAYNVEVGFDSTGGAPPLADNVVVFSDANKAAPANKGCVGKTLGGDMRDCAYALTLNPSPGVDYSLADWTPLSNIGVQYVSPPAATDAIPGMVPTPQPFNRGNYTIVTQGLDIDDASAMKRAAPLSIRFQIRAVKDAQNEGWQDLFFGGELIDPACTSNCPKYNPTTHPIDNFRAGLQFQAASNMYLNGLDLQHAPVNGVLDRILTGSWRTEEDFYVKACLETAETQAGDPLYAGSDGKANDCKTVQMRIVRAQPPVQSASSLAYNKDYTKSIGKDEQLSFTTTATGSNAIDTTGAHLALDAEAHLTSTKLLNTAFGGPTLNLFTASVRGESLLGLTGSHIDATVTLYTYNLFTYSKVITDKFAWALPNMPISKSYSTTFKYFAVPLVGMDMNLGATGVGALTANLNVSASTGPGAAPFDTAVKNGSVGGTLTPSASVSGQNTADLTVTGKYKLGSASSFKLLDMTTTVASTMSWGQTRVAPPLVRAASKVIWTLSVTPLQGATDVSLAYLAPCASGCPKEGTYNVFTVAPTGFNNTLISSQAQAVLGQ